MSLIATPEVAAFSVGILKTKPEPWGQSSLYKTTSSDRPFEVADIPGKEKGLVAKRMIKKGDVILDEIPLLISFATTLEGIPMASNPDLLRLAFEQLPEKQKTSLEALARTTGGHYYEDIMRTNAFSIDVDGAGFSAIFPDIATKVTPSPGTQERRSEWRLLLNEISTLEKKLA
ncbi:hypothetical protein SAPIO_CDS4556 [Scedosporium apiospermum]|uniref:Uncharacterized protein n=1 Tax=Pseudallescheria apiosperma TaxID=563466 RepID=A0A084G7S5_PSEDA|nr:uncharacterized protein SAPIO_CDS4556 [Scedosporium apiospermum]KEZ43387.1 hypothetical protein SAPIO_CDS4556 [Scedosporium apiospermum]